MNRISGTVSPVAVPEYALRFPPAADGMRIGLFGGSFNPPHQGHLLVSETVLNRCRLDFVWWIVTPGNPLKDHGELTPLGERIARCRALARHPRIAVTAFEARWQMRYTADTLALLRRRFPKVRFVWIMGADNLANFHRWQNWRKIAAMMPMVVVDRPGSTLAYHSARAAVALQRWRIDETDAELLADLQPPAWTFLHGPRSSLSSTALRRMATSGRK